MKKLFISAIKFYQKRISPHFSPRCRFYPTCSQYALEAIEIHGAFKGGLLAFCRLMRCNPLFPGGLDPVPPKKRKSTEDKK
ncbi:MAG: membrane protein insertion efficiency factor YidD [Clostridia bacterium]|nr:membrane protein insertion efficiency factor YidD [Clostridia bacterium]